MTTPLCPTCGSETRERANRQTGNKFFGCVRYPACKGTVDGKAFARQQGNTGKRVVPASAGGMLAKVASAQPIKAEPPERRIPMPSSAEADAAFEKAVAKLDVDQRVVAAWKPEDGNARVIAAAGSGKTTTVVALVGKLVRAGLAPSDLVVTTFTRKAGGELKERLAAVLPPGALDRMRVGTFHALALRALVRNEAAKWPWGRCMDGSASGRNKRDADVPSTMQLWRAIVTGFRLIPGTNQQGLSLERVEPKAYAQAAGLLFSRGLKGNDLRVEARKNDGALKHFSLALDLFEAAKKGLNAWTFDDAMVAYLDRLKTGRIVDGAGVVIVDEAQDDSLVQLEIAQQLSRQGSLMLVGDVRQAIYEWRGAAPDMFADADHTIGAKTFQLRSNYRSAKRIVAIGNNVARGQSWNIGDEAVAQRQLDGEVRVLDFTDPATQADGVADEIQAELASKSDDANAFAILCRTNAELGLYESALVSRSIPCVVVGGTPWFKRAEVVDFLAYCVLSERDDVEALERIINKPKRFLGSAFIESVKVALSSRPGRGLLDAIEVAGLAVKSNQQDGVLELLQTLRALRAAGWPAASRMAAQLFTRELEEVAQVDAGGDDDRASIYDTASAMAARFPNASALERFAERCAKDVDEVDSEKDDLPAGRVVISSVHRAKGLEWRRLYVSASAGVFPHRRSENLGEEQRLFYVATTRAKDSVTFLWSEVNVNGKPAGMSTFIADFVNPELPGAPKGPGGGEPVEPDYHPDIPDRDPAPPAAYEAALASILPAPAFSAALEAAQLVADVRTAEEPAARPGPGGRFVDVTREGFEELLKPFGFVPAPAGVSRTAGQAVYDLYLDTAAGPTAIRVYSSIPAASDGARTLGQDSMKVAALRVTPEGKIVPLHGKLTRVFRTRGWRRALLERVAEAHALAASRASSPIQPVC